MPEFIALVQQNSTIYIIVASLLGLVVGSFLNVIIYRIPKQILSDSHDAIKDNVFCNIMMDELKVGIRS